ncbi:hypothetical protein, partial [Maridesulfovibrio ferrireducens]|uniref:hypothetical protein n=1 Tax=Maridesulfovibrio ferrireducens TaxID=246191 RepID=UPI001A2CAE0F
GALAVEYKDRCYIFGSYSNTAAGEIGKFNYSDNSVSILTTAAIPNGTVGMAGCLGNDGKIYLFGGRTSLDVVTVRQDILRFDPETETIETIKTGVADFRDYSSACTHKATGDIYIFGKDNKLLRYILSSNTLTTASVVTVGGYGQPVCVGDTVYYFDMNTVTKKVVPDGASETITLVGLDSTKVSSAGISEKGDIYVVNTTKVFKFDPSADTVEDTGLVFGIAPQYGKLSSGKRLCMFGHYGGDTLDDISYISSGNSIVDITALNLTEAPQNISRKNNISLVLAAGAVDQVFTEVDFNISPTDCSFVTPDGKLICSAAKIDLEEDANLKQLAMAVRGPEDMRFIGGKIYIQEKTS